jgi:hypothetical protein
MQQLGWQGLSDPGGVLKVSTSAIKRIKSSKYIYSIIAFAGVGGGGQGGAACAHMCVRQRSLRGRVHALLAFFRSDGHFVWGGELRLCDACSAQNGKRNHRVNECVVRYRAAVGPCGSPPFTPPRPAYSAHRCPTRLMSGPRGDLRKSCAEHKQNPLTAVGDSD